MIIRRFLAPFIVITISLMFILSGTLISSADIVRTDTIETEKWTWIVYSSADANKTGGGILYPFSSEAFSSENIDVLILQDTQNDSGKIWHVENDHTVTLLEDIGEINMGNYTTLKNFVTYCKDNFPADRYMIFFYGHGGAWKGACREETEAGKDRLTMDEMQKAFTDAGEVDVICFSGPCLMSAVESAYELRNFTDIYIGSEAPCGYNYWRGTIKELCLVLDESPNISNADIGRFIIESVKEKTATNPYISFVEKKVVSMSAIQTNTLKNLVESIDQLAKDLSTKIPKSSFRIRLIRLVTRAFTTSLDPLKMNVVDIYDFASRCTIFFLTDNTISQDAKNVMSSVNNVVIATYRGILQLRTHGLSVYFPRCHNQYDNSYTTLGLDFIDDTQWDEFLERYLNR